MTEDTTKLTGTVEEVATLIGALRSPEQFSEERPFAIVPDGFKTENLREFGAHIDNRKASPLRVRKDIKFVNVDSFIAYFNQFKGGYFPQIFSKLTTSGLDVMAVFDYDVPQGKGKDDTIVDVGTEPKWNSNRIYLALAYAREYKELLAASQKWHDQEDFALFIEENTHLFVEPDGASMLELAQGLKGVRNVSWQHGKRLSNSQTSLEYIEQIEARSERGEIKVPEYLNINAPMYEGFDNQPIRAAFRWKIGGSSGEKKLQFTIRLLTKQQEQIAEQAVKDKIASATGLPLLAVSDFDGVTAKKF